MNQTFLRATCAALITLTASAASASCYTIYNGKGKLVQQTAKPPVDMRDHLHSTVPKKFGKGATMTMEVPVASTCIDYVTPGTKAAAKPLNDADAVLEDLMSVHNERSGRVPATQR